MTSVAETPARPLPAPAPPGWDPFSWGLVCYTLTSLIAFLGIVLGHDYLRPAPFRLTEPTNPLNRCANWDGQWFITILKDGYSYDPLTHSNSAFFPAFPLLGRLIVNFTGLRAELALLLLSHLSLVTAFVVLATYLRGRCAEPHGSAGLYGLLAFGLLPPTFFFRMAYSESLFLLTAVLTLYGMERKWALPLIALLIGSATATRAVGVALLLPFSLHLRDRSPTWPGLLLRGAVLLPLACWGLLAFMTYQYAAFGDPLAFARTQEHWRQRPAVPQAERAVSLLTLEPLWSIFDPASPCYWRRHEPQGNPLFSLHLANPLYFVFAVVLIAIGAWKRWLNRLEVSLAAGLLLIPYVTRSHEMCLAGMGRFAAAIVPLYLVLGQLLARLPPPVAAMLLSLSGFLMGVYAALFAAWYRFF